MVITQASQACDGSSILLARLREKLAAILTLGPTKVYQLGIFVSEPYTLEASSPSAISLNDILTYRFLSEPVFAPRSEPGSLPPLAFRVRIADYEKNRYASDLWIAVCASTHERADNAAAQWKVFRLTSCGTVGAFTWEDGEHLLFSSDRDPDDAKKREEGEQFNRFYRINIHGGEADPLFRSEMAVSDLSVLSEGRILLKGVYQRTDEEERKARKDAGVTIASEIPVWSNGSGFTGDSRPALFHSDMEGNSERITGDSLAVDSFKVSDDDDTVLFTGRDYEGKRPVANALYAYARSTGSVTRLSDDVSRVYGPPVFCKAGEAVVPVNSMAEYGLNENPDFYRVDVQAGTLTPITSGLDRSLGSSVGSDCRHGGGTAIRYFDGGVFFISTEDEAAGLRRLDVETGRVDDVYAPQGSVDSFDICDGTVVAVGLSRDSLQELYSVSQSETTSTYTSSGIQSVTALNREALAQKQLARPEPLSVTREDGTEIHGFVLAPPQADSDRKLPGVLTIHGGPKTVYGEVFYHEMQLLAAEGYYVFFCNPRGSDGRGNAFADIRGRYGAIDYEDIMAFTDRVLEVYGDRIDSSRLAVMGGSYGGFMTNWIIGSSDRFACAISQRGISSWLSMWGTSDIGFYFAEDQVDGDPWARHEALWRQSPLRLAPNVKTPVLLIHSRADYRCWEVEAFQYLTAIRYHGGTARLALFDGESHELSRSGSPKPRIRRLEEILGWLREYLA